MNARRHLRRLLVVAVTGLCTAYIVWKIDLGRTADVLAEARLGYLAAALALLVAAIPPLAWRWQALLAARGVDEPLSWLVRAYFVSYAAGQVLPTSLGGDATRIFEAGRRSRDRVGDVAGSVLLERALGGCATLTLGALGFVLALGRYDVGAYLWLELLLFTATAVLGVVVFARSARPALRTLAPLFDFLRIGRPLRAVYEGMHAFREERGLLARMFALTLAVQAFRVLTIWLGARAVGVDLSPLPFYVMGPLFFVVMLVPFTINGLAVREAFFVSFLGRLDVPAEEAFAAGFLYFLLSIGLALPGLAILAWEGIRGPTPRRAGRSSSD